MKGKYNVKEIENIFFKNRVQLILLIKHSKIHLL